MNVIDREHAKHYHWKTVCDGRHLVDSEELSIIAEKNAAAHVGGYALSQ